MATCAISTARTAIMCALLPCWVRANRSSILTPLAFRVGRVALHLSVWLIAVCYNGATSVIGLLQGSYRSVRTCTRGNLRVNGATYQRYAGWPLIISLLLPPVLLPNVHCPVRHTVVSRAHGPATVPLPTMAVEQWHVVDGVLRLPACSLVFKQRTVAYGVEVGEAAIEASCYDWRKLIA